MATPLKRICLHTSRQAIARSVHRRQWQLSRSVSSTAQRRQDGEIQRATQATDEITDAMLDELSNQPGVKYTMTEETEDLSKLGMDNISSLAYREIEQHKEMREMARIAAWEMPLLSQFAKPFELPAEDQVLRWRYTSYLGEPHPAARKVVVEFQPEKLKDIRPEQREKLLKLAGTRYNPSTKTVRMSCESFETQAQNKRYLADTISRLLAEAKDLKSDSFADVPVDLRHHKTKIRPEFPKAWIMTPERKAELESSRKAALLEEGQRVERDKVVSGVAAIESAMHLDTKQEKQAVPVPARASAKTGANSRRR